MLLTFLILWGEIGFFHYWTMCSCGRIDFTRLELNNAYAVFPWWQFIFIRVIPVYLMFRCLLYIIVSLRIFLLLIGLWISNTIRSLISEFEILELLERLIFNAPYWIFSILISISTHLLRVFKDVLYRQCLNLNILNFLWCWPM